YGEAIMAAAQHMANTVAQAKGVQITERLPRRIHRTTSNSIPWPVVLGFIFIIILLMRRGGPRGYGGSGGGGFLPGLILGNMMSRGSWGSRGSGGFGGYDSGDGGFGGFGGGDSGGGGASSDWEGTGMDEKILNQLVERLRKAFGDRLASGGLYGSAAPGEHPARFSDYNILCVLADITPRELGEGEEIFRWWREQGSPAPLLLSEHEVQTSTDCFAIEFHDIQEHHRLLHGRDVISGLTIDNSFYRAQVEHDLRAKLLRLRQKASGMLSDAGLLRRLLVDSVSTFCVLFRHALRLHGVNPGPKKRDVIAHAQQHFGIDGLPFQKLLEIREEATKPGDVEPVALLGAYLKGIGTVIDAVDRLEK